MNQRTKERLVWLVLLCIAALLFGSAVYLWVHRVPVVAAIEANHADAIVADMKDTFETATARIEEQDSKTRTEVRVIYETVRRQVSALSADDVAFGLNAELAMWRGMDSGPAGLDGD
jgi:uncharacterized iron-regulated membrane protein